MKTFYFKIYIGQRYFKSHTRKFNNDICQFKESKWNSLVISILFIYLFISFIFISWRLITLQCCSGFCHTLTWISHGFTCIPHPDTPPTSLSTWSLWIFPVHLARVLVSCIPPGLVICFTLDSIHVSMLFSWNIPPLPSPTEPKSLFYTYVSLFLFCI